MKFDRSQIETSHVYPPIPDRNFDWSATLKGYESGDAIGRGPIEEAAVLDLLEQLSELEDQ